MNMAKNKNDTKDVCDKRVCHGRLSTIVQTKNG